LGSGISITGASGFTISGRRLPLFRRLVNLRKLKAIIRTSASVGAMRRSLCKPRRSRDCMRTTSSWPPRLTAYSLGRPRRERVLVVVQLAPLFRAERFYPPNKIVSAGLGNLGIDYSVADLAKPEVAADIDAFRHGRTGRATDPLPRRYGPSRSHSLAKPNIHPVASPARFNRDPRCIASRRRALWCAGRRRPPQDLLARPRLMR
jgi:hypothetical protein